MDLDQIHDEDDIETQVLTLLKRLGTKRNFAKEFASLTVYQLQNETATRADVLILREDLRAMKASLDKVVDMIEQKTQDK
jgi:hypothetical protein